MIVKLNEKVLTIKAAPKEEDAFKYVHRYRESTVEYGQIATKEHDQADRK